MKIICYRLEAPIDLYSNQIKEFITIGAHMLINFSPGMAHVIALDHVSEIRHLLEVNLNTDCSVLESNDTYTSLYMSTKPDFEARFVERVIDNIKFDYRTAYPETIQPQN